MSKIVIYSTPICSYCTDVKKFLSDRDIAFEEKDITKDKEALVRMKNLSKQMSVPVVEIGDEFIVGYEPDKMNEVLGL